MKEIETTISKISNFASCSMPKLAESDLERSTLELGFEIPHLLVELYKNIGNGGFGPGYGLLGLLNGARDDMGNTAISLYKLNREPDPDDETWKWPDRLIPICHWGCAIYTCLDCSNEEGLLTTFDPNQYKDNWDTCFYPTKRNFQSWILAWTQGVDLWKEANNDPE